MIQQHQDGFTLVEALVALLIISLSLASVFEASRFVSRMDRPVVAVRQTEQADAAFQADLTRRLAPLQPIDAHGLSGDAHRMSLSCDPSEKKQTCAIDAPGNRQFAYVSGGRTLTQWPPVAVEGAEPPRLEDILIRDGRGNIISTIKLPVEHNRNCQFDMISRTCRVQQPSPDVSAQNASASTTAPQ